MRRVLQATINGEAFVSVELVMNHLVAVADQTMRETRSITHLPLRICQSTHLGAGMMSLISCCTKGAPMPAFSDNVKTSASSSSEPRIRELPMSLKVGAMLRSR